MSFFPAYCDEFHVSTRLFLKLELESSRETVLQFFERVRKEFPGMSKLRRRDDGGLVLEECDETDRPRRYVRLDSNALRFGAHNPEKAGEVASLGKSVLTQAPAYLSLGELDLDYMEIVFSFDLEYRGNHDELVAEALLADHPFFAGLGDDGQRVLDCQPFWGLSLTPECDVQAYVEVRGRTTTFEIRSGDYEQNSLTVYSSVRRYWGIRPAKELPDAHRELLALCDQFTAQRVVPHVVQPLAQAIASRR